MSCQNSQFNGHTCQTSARAQIIKSAHRHMIIHIVKTNLDAVTVREWEEYKVNNEIPNLKQFLKGRADLLESVEDSQRESQGQF
jgi:hypothetical protein